MMESKLRDWQTLLLAGMVVVAATAVADGQGIVLPRSGLRPPTLTAHYVKVQIEEQVARVSATHRFVNENKRRLEGVFYFPLPREAQVTDITVSANGKTLEGELLEEKEAERIYEEIVRKDLDPALLKMADYRLLKLSVYPLQPGEEQTVKVRYQMEIPVDGGTARFMYPLREDIRAGRSAGVPWVPGRPRVWPTLQAREDAQRGVAGEREKPESRRELEERFEIGLHSALEVENVYSPTHEIEIERGDEGSVLVRWEGRRKGEGDFTLFWSLARGPMAVSLLSYKKPDEDGYFFLSIAPSLTTNQERIPLDLVFVLDTSGSMEGEKLEQAKRALDGCLQELGPRDRFGLVTFSNSTRLFQDQLRSGQEWVRKAQDFARALEAEGGTNLCAALEEALAFGAESDRLQLIVLLTDGQPTTGITDKGEILKRLREKNVQGRCVFIFGIGSDVNTHLLDKISQFGKGMTFYVKEGLLEQEVQNFFAKVRNPVLTDATLDLGETGSYDLYPVELPHLFRGTELRIAGRYRTSGSHAVRLLGSVSGQRLEYRFDLDFPARNTMYDFVPRIWAARKIGYLLDQIRLNRESEELRSEVVKLSKKYGILTPYTGYLVRDQSEELVVVPGMPFMQARPGSLPPRAVPGRSTRTFVAAPGDPNNLGLSGAADLLAAEAGVVAVRAARAISSLKRAELLPQASTDVQHVAARLFRFDGERWLQIDLPDSEPVKIKYGSRAYLWLLQTFPEIRDILALGKKVTFSWKGTVISVTGDGIEKVEDLPRDLHR